MDFHISCFPRDLLQRIFQIGLKEVWGLSNPEVEELEDDSEEEEDLDPFGVEKRNQNGYPDRFKPDYDPFRAHPELLTLIDCTQVCTAWADAIMDKEYWDSLSPESYGRALAEPWKVGKRWNRLLNYVPVPILSVNEELLSNIGKIHISILRGRDAFEVYVVSNSDQKEHILEAWFNLQPFLQPRCVRLTITNPIVATGRDRFNRTRVDFLPLMLTKWPLLQSLDIDTSAIEVFTRETFKDRQDNFKPVLSSDPPFPALKRLCLTTHVDTQAAQAITLLAPHIEDCRIEFSGHKGYDLINYERSRTSGVYLQFLRHDKCFRVYILPFCLLAFKWPGPKTLRDYKEVWGVHLLTLFPKGIVLISERRDRKICELHLTASQCFEVEDLRFLSIP